MKELFLNRGFDYNFDWQLSDVDSDNDLEDEQTKESSLINNHDIIPIERSNSGSSDDIEIQD